MNRRQLIESNISTAAYFANRVCFTKNRSDPAWQDAFQAGCLAICEAAEAYDPSKGEFHPYAVQCVENAVRRLRFLACRDRKTLLSTRDLKEGSAGEDSWAESDISHWAEFGAATVPSPEELLLEAAERAEGQARLAKLPEAEQLDVERLLSREYRKRETANPVAWAERVGVRVPEKDRPAPRATARGSDGAFVSTGKRLSGAERSRAWYARLSPEAKAADLERRRLRSSIAA